MNGSGLNKIIGFSRLLIVASLSFVAVTSVRADTFPTSGQFDQVNSIVAPRMSVRIVQSITFKGGDIRLDSDDPQAMIPTTQIETPEAVYIYSSIGTTGQKAPVKEGQPPLLERMAADTKAKLAGAVKSGTDTVEGYNCDTYKLTQPNSQETIEFWVSTDPQFPFLLKTVVTDPLLQKTTTVELQNIVLNNAIDDSIFAVPTNIKFTVPSAAPSAQVGSSSATSTHSSSGTGSGTTSK